MDPKIVHPLLYAHTPYLVLTTKSMLMFPRDSSIVALVWTSDGATGDRGEQSRNKDGGGIDLGLSEDVTAVFAAVG